MRPCAWLYYTRVTLRLAVLHPCDRISYTTPVTLAVQGTPVTLAVQAAPVILAVQAAPVTLAVQAAPVTLAVQATYVACTGTPSGTRHTWTPPALHAPAVAPSCPACTCRALHCQVSPFPSRALLCPAPTHPAPPRPACPACPVRTCLRTLLPCIHLPCTGPPSAALPPLALPRPTPPCLSCRHLHPWQQPGLAPFPQGAEQEGRLVAAVPAALRPCRRGAAPAQGDGRDLPLQLGAQGGREGLVRRLVR